MAMVEVARSASLPAGHPGDPVLAGELAGAEGELRRAGAAPRAQGKTTLLTRAGIAADLRHGRVAGPTSRTLSENALARWRSRHIGFIFQFYNLIPVLTAAENVELRSSRAAFARAGASGRSCAQSSVSHRSQHYPRTALGDGAAVTSRASSPIPRCGRRRADGRPRRRSAEEILDLMQKLNATSGKPS